MFSKQIRGHTLLLKLIRPGSLVIDAGAHRAEFAKQIARSTSANVIAFEPNRTLWDRLTPGDRIELRAQALGPQSGTTRFQLSRDLECSSLLDNTCEFQESIDVESVTLETILASEGFHEVDCLKLDIEGAECDVLLSAPPTTLSACRQITVEFHDFLYPELREKVDQCFEHLVRSGFRCLVMSRTTREDVLFVRRDIASRYSVRLSMVGGIEKYSRGAVRMMSRHTRFRSRLGATSD